MQYTQEDYQLNNRELRNKWLIFLTVLAVFIALSVYFVIKRMQVVCSIVSLLFLPVYFFLFAAYLLPPIRYHRFLKDAITARRHERELVFIRYEMDTDVREGVHFTPMIVMDDEGFEHRLYWDAQKPLADLTEGDRVMLTTFGQNIVAMEKIGA